MEPNAEMPEAEGREHRPLLSIGLPVYNGAEHLAQSLDSLLAQDVEDLELVISDNASTDDTTRICVEFASRDPRVRYTRNETNIGAAANFNRAFELCSGRYFMWGSDDDVWDPRFASACIERLESSPEAVMCTSQLAFIAEDGRSLPSDWYESLDTDGMSVEGRVHEFVRRLSWYGMYSVFRPEALRRTHLYRSSFGGDVCLLLELLILGQAVTVPATLLRYRMPTDGKTAPQYVAEIRSQSQIVATAEEIQRPYLFLARTLMSIVEESLTDAGIVATVRDDFVNTIVTENAAWGRMILAELGLRTDLELPPSLMMLEVERALSAQSPERIVTVPGTGSWSIQQGMRLRWPRALLLRILKPFTEMQDRFLTQQATTISLLADQVRSLEKRVEELERGRDE